MSVSTNYKGPPTTFTMLDVVLQHEKDYNKPEVVYEFSNGRKFLNTDKSDSGIYDGS